MSDNAGNANNAPGALLEPFHYQLLDQVPARRGTEYRVKRHDECDDAL